MKRSVAPMARALEVSSTRTIGRPLAFRAVQPHRTFCQSSHQRSIPLTSFRFASTNAAPLLDSSSSLHTHQHQSEGSSSGSSSSSPPPPPESEPEPTSAYARFKALSKKYGWWGLGVYALLSPLDFSLCLFVIHSLGAERIEPLFDAALRQYRLIVHGQERTTELEAEDVQKKEEARIEDEKIKAEGKKKSGWGSKTLWAEVGLAYAIHKTAFLPVRAGLTVAITPRLVGWLTQRGWVGKVSSSSKRMFVVWWCA